ncbi:MAG: DMP19 family protein [Prevotella sp.]|nr:DMP19 family protein [Prevotella sp.]
MKEVYVNGAALRKAASKGMDAFVKVFVDAINKAIGGNLNAETMAELNADQVTLLAWNILHEELMDGGFVQLIHNGYGGFIFLNPFSKAMTLWQVDGLAPLVNKAHKLYSKYKKDIEAECSDEEFMALYERFPMFDDLDDRFVENEERWTAMVAHYLDDHIDRFATIVAD